MIYKVTSPTMVIDRIAIHKRLSQGSNIKNLDSRNIMVVAQMHQERLVLLHTIQVVYATRARKRI